MASTVLNVVGADTAPFKMLKTANLKIFLLNNIEDIEYNTWIYLFFLFKLNFGQIFFVLNFLYSKIARGRSSLPYIIKLKNT